ncbi:MAG: haloalkane dehalogenase [Pseudonocardia sp.]|jgi:haloalkane dehalogenase|nr:haloalkane dehalogenase [Pseudonocardia sp.]
MPTVHVLDSTMSYLDQGSGTPIVFLHGNPTSSYVWRKVLRRIGRQGRLLAPDLIGMGESGKPPLGYRFADHARYLDAWFDALGLDRVVLVGHDWGGALAFDWATLHPDRVLGVAFMETILKPMSWEEFPEGGRDRFQKLRTPGVGEHLVLDRNIFIEDALQRTILSGLDSEDHDVYRKPYLSRESRLPLLVWPRSMPIDGEPADVVARVKAYDEWLESTPQVPKLLLTFGTNPTLMIGPAMADWCEQHIAGLEVEDCGEAGHNAPEDRPAEIADAITAWARRHQLLGDASPACAAATRQGEPAYRVDRFVVPETALDEFMAGVRRTHRLLEQQPGFVYDLLLEGESSAGTRAVVTLAAWTDDAALAEARTVVRDLHEQTHFSPQETFTRLGITAEIGNYSPLARSDR